MFLRFLLIGFFLSLSACASVQQNVEPTQPAQPEERLLTQAIETQGNAAGGEFLTTVDEAFNQDPSLIAAKLQVTNTLEEADRADDYWKPEVATNLAQGEGDDANGTLTITQPLYDFGKGNAEADALLNQAAVNRVSLDQARATLVEKMLGAMITAGESQARIQLNQRRIAAFTQSLERAKRLLQMNLATASDTRLAEVRLNEARKDLETARITFSQAEANWLRYSGRSELPRGGVISDLRSRFGLQSSDQALTLALTHNLDMRAAQQQLFLLQSELRSQRASYRPTLNAVSTTQLDPPDGTRRTNVQLSLSYNLYSSSRRDALESADDEIQVQQARITQLENDLKFDIQLLEQNIRDYGRLAALDRSGINALRERADDLESKLDTGLIPFDQVLNARSEQFDAELSALSNQYASERAIAQLLILSGVFTGVR